MGKTLDILVDKARVLDEVQKTTDYLGKKLLSEKDPGAYERVPAVDADREQLDRYWLEACTGADTALGEWMTGVGVRGMTHHVELGRDYGVRLSLSEAWNGTLGPAVKDSLTSYFVNYIFSQWLLMVYPEHSEVYARLAAGALADVDTKLRTLVAPKKG